MAIEGPGPEATAGVGPIVRRWWVIVGSSAVMATSAWLLFRLLAPIRFTIDEWMFVINHHDVSFDSLLRNHNGHPSVLPAVALLFGFHTVGFGSMWYYKTVLILVHLGVCALLARHVWRRHGPVVSAAVWVTVCFMAAGAQNIVQLFQIGFDGSVLLFLVSLAVLERLVSAGRRRDAIWLAVVLTASISCSSVGLAAVASAGAVLVLDRRTRPHLWAVIVPLLLYLVWRRAYGGTTTSSGDWEVMVRFVWAAIRTCGAAIAFGNEVLGAVLVVGLLVLAGWRSARNSSPLILAGPVFVLSFWALTALGRAEFQAAVNDISPPRYRYVAVVGLLVALCDVMPPQVGNVRRILASAVAASAAATSVWVGHSLLFTYRDMFANWSWISASRLSVVDAYPETVRRDTWFEPLLSTMAPSRYHIDEYLEVSSALGTRGGLGPNEFSEVPTPLLFGAEELMLPLLEISDHSAPTCIDVGPAGTVVRLEPGGSLYVDVGAGGTLVAARWIPPNPEGAGRRSLGPGRWRIAAPSDPLPGSWTLDFVEDARLLECPPES